MDSYGKPTGISRTIKNIGSKATYSAVDKVQRTAIGNQEKTTKASRAVERQSTERSGKPLHKGSAAGMNNESPTHLIVNETGYYNRKNQQARLSKQHFTPQQTTRLRTEVMRARKDIRLFRRGISTTHTSSFSKLSKLLDRN